MSVARLIATRVFAVSGAALVIATLAGCESGPNGKPLPYGASCGSIRSELRKLQKELFIRSEKLHLSEQMLKLKDKEGVTLRNKITAMTEAADRASKEHARALQRKD